MLTPPTIVAIAYVLIMVALMIWVGRREAKARSAYRRRAAIIAHIREGVEKNAPIIGWMVRDDPAPAKPGRHVGGSHQAR